MRVLVATLVGLWLGPACTEPSSARCKSVCSREAECHDQAGKGQGETAFDEGDCVAACAALEKDRELIGTVERYADCVTQAGASCEAVLACE
jgi:hypothetical protein